VDVTEDGRRYLAVVAEPAEAGIDFTAAARSIRQVAAAEAGVGISEWVFVARGELPKSPSGKIQRFRCRALIVEGGPSTLAEFGSGDLRCRQLIMITRSPPRRSRARSRPGQAVQTVSDLLQERAGTGTTSSMAPR